MGRGRAIAGCLLRGVAQWGEIKGMAVAVVKQDTDLLSECGAVGKDRGSCQHCCEEVHRHNWESSLKSEL